ncbi:MAG: DNA-binding response regulator [Acidobacteria bacterium]|nr:DNA-binding response regulator [Acidobacteriota bacterium]
MSIRIVIADDHGVLRAGLRALLNAEPDLEVVDEAADGDAAERLALRWKPDVVLLDVSMPGPTGIEVAARIKRQLPATHVLILTVHEDESLLRAALDAGASGYIVKRAVESELINAIRAIARGEVYVHPAVTRGLLDRKAPGAGKGGAGRFVLSRRELEVVRMIARGRTNREVADELGLSVRTVETHRANAMAKLELETRAELVDWVAKNRLLD